MFTKAIHPRALVENRVFGPSCFASDEKTVGISPLISPSFHRLQGRLLLQTQCKTARSHEGIRYRDEIDKIN